MQQGPLHSALAMQRCQGAGSARQAEGAQKKQCVDEAKRTGARALCNNAEQE